MTSNDIYSILSSKPHNPHYLKRYWKFIQWCQDANQNTIPEYTEEHHICPKAKDLFPEYKSTSKYQWNIVNLSNKQHIIAHVILWKSYGGGQAQALDYIINRFNSGSNQYSLSERKIPTSIVIRYAAKIREEVRIMSLGMSTYKDKEGNKFYIHKDDPKIQELNLIGNNAGIKFSEDSIESLRRSKDHNRVITMYFLGMRTSVKVREMQMYLDQGWTTSRTDADKKEGRLSGSPAKTEKMKGRSKWAYPDGTYFDFIHKDDPRIQELGLICYETNKCREGYLKRAALAKEANQDSQFYNDGTIMKKFKTDPGAPWVLGQLDRDRSAQKEACAKRKGKLSWTNGVTNTYAIESPGPEWKRGMAPRKK